MDNLKVYTFTAREDGKPGLNFNVDQNPYGRIVILTMLKVRFIVKYVYVKSIKFVENKQTIIKTVYNSTLNTFCSFSPLQTLKYLPHIGHEYLKVIPVSITDCNDYIDVIVNVHEAIYLPANTTNIHIEPTFSKTVLENDIDNVEYDYNQINLIDTNLNPANHDSLVQLYTAVLLF